MPIYNEKDESKWTKDGRHWYFKCQIKTKTGATRQYKSKKYLTQDECEYEYGLYKVKHNLEDDNVRFTYVGESFFEDYKKRRKFSSYEANLYAYNKWILPYFENYYINKITINDCKEWMKWIEEKDFSVNYENRLHDVLKMIFNFAIVNFAITNNPIQIVGRFERKKDTIIKDEEKIRYITSEEFEKFISVVDDELYKSIFIFLFHTGCRKGEMLSLTWNDIDFDKNVIKIYKTLYYKHKKGEITNTKTGVNRTIKMSSLLSTTLREHKNLMKQYSDFSEDWFVFGNTKFIAPTTLDRVKHNYFVKSGVREITIHEFRHSHVSNLVNLYLKQGQTDSTKFFLTMSDRMGHSVEVMKKTYLHLFDTTQDEIIDLLENL